MTKQTETHIFNLRLEPTDWQKIKYIKKVERRSAHEQIMLWVSSAIKDWWRDNPEIAQEHEEPPQ